jgi:hypothetical protein
MTLVLAALGMAALIVAVPSIAQGPPADAGERGPPAHAAASGPPDHAGAADAAASTEHPTAGEDADTGEETTDDAETATDPIEDPEADEASTEAPATTSTAIGTAAPTTTDGGQPAAVVSGSGSSGPSPSGTGSSTAPGIGASFLVLGPALAFGLMALGLVARARYPGAYDGDHEADAEPGDVEPMEDVDEEPAEPEPDAEADEATTQPAAPRPGPVGLLTLGRQALDRGDVEEAAEWFRTVTMAEPDRQVAHFCLGLCLEKKGELAEAEAALAEARRLRPGDVETAYAHAQVLARQGRTREALRELEALADDMPGLAERLQDDEAWASLRDHPRWLALTGELADRFDADQPEACLE